MSVERKIFLGSILAAGGLLLSGCEDIENLRMTNCSYDNSPETHTKYLREDAMGFLHELRIGETIFLFNPDKKGFQYFLFARTGGQTYPVNPHMPFNITDGPGGRDYSITFSSKNPAKYEKVDVIGVCPVTYSQRG